MPTAMNWKETDIDTNEKRSKYIVSIIGCGQVGLSTACLFSNARFKVICVDSNSYVINLLKKGKILSEDPNLAEKIKKNVKEGRIIATIQAKEAASKSDVIIFAVAPTIDQKKKPDYSSISNACKEMGAGLGSGSLIIVETITVPGITETVVKKSLEKSSGLRAGIDFGLVHIAINSSLRSVLQDVIAQPKVIGANDEQSLKIGRLVLGQIVKAEIIEVTNIKTAEAILLLENICYDVNHALATELALFCEKAGIDFYESQKAINTQYKNYLLAPDVLGGYFSTDPYLLFEEAENINAEFHLAVTARKINTKMLNHTLRLTRKAMRSCGKTLRNAKILILGVSNHPSVREINKTFIKDLANLLTKNGARVYFYDPLFSQKQLIELDYPAEKTLRKSFEGTDCLIFTVEHQRFKRLKLKRMKFFVRKPAAIIDLANAFDPNEAEKEGFAYRGLGKG